MTLNRLAQLPGWRQLNGAKHPDDIAKVRALLAEAGHPDGFAAGMMVRQAVECPDQAVVYKEQMKKIGIDIAIKLEEGATGFQRYMRGDWVTAIRRAGISCWRPMPSSERTGCRRGILPGTPGPSRPNGDRRRMSGGQHKEKRKAILRKMEDFLILEDPTAAR